MELKDVKPNSGKIDVVVQVISKDAPRTFEKFGKAGRVCNAKIRDTSGEMTLTLWNDEADVVKVGDKIRIQNGWCSEYKGERQLSAGKFGKIEVMSSGAEVFTNDPGKLQQAQQLDTEDADEADAEDISEEEFVD